MRRIPFNLTIGIIFILSEFSIAKSSTGTPSKNPKIIIVGAGVSGIAAASKLIENGFTNIKILEAESRIGGRIHTVQIGDWTVDLGAHWVHGEGGNIVNEIASPLGLLEDSEDGGKFTTVFSDGAAYNYNNIFDEYSEISEDRTFLLSKKNMSLHRVFLERVKPKIKEFFKSDERTDLYLKWFSQMSCVLEGCNVPDDVSASRSLDFRDTNGSFVMGWKGKGYKSILDILLKRHEKCQGPPIDLEGKLFLNTEVTNIETKENGVLVTTKNGTAYEADIVLVTVSLGVLKKRHNTLFTPPLPDYKVKVIESLGIGTIAKIILLFEKPWWPAENGFGFVWLNKDKSLGQENNSWEEEILSFDTERWSPNTLTSWMVGQASWKMETTPVEEVKKSCMRVLKKFLGANYTISEPLQIIRSTWGTNPHFSGSYSFNTVQFEMTNGSRTDLERPLTDQSGREIILFAGEATNDHFYSTVHGALETGWREAERIIKAYS